MRFGMVRTIFFKNRSIFFKKAINIFSKLRSSFGLYLIFWVAASFTINKIPKHINESKQNDNPNSTE